MKNLLTDIQIAPEGGFTGAKDGKGLLAAPGNGIEMFTKFISSVIGLLTIIAIIWFVFTFIAGAIGIISSGGDKTALESAKKKITTAIVGLVVTVIAVFIISLVGYLLGFSNILDIGAMFKAITP